MWQISETESRLKSQEIKTGIYRVISVAVKSHGHAFGKCAVESGLSLLVVLARLMSA